MNENKNLDNIKIRTHFDPTSNEWYFSVVDIIGFIIKSSNPSNYWKVQKNRLKIKYPELVTECNQLKMPAKDGKMYLTDVANAHIIYKIIETLSPNNLKELRDYLYKFEENNIDIKTEENYEFKLLIDAYQNTENIFIKAMIAGVKNEDLFISITFDKVVISGKRIKNMIEIEKIFSQELKYGTFSRTIPLPEGIDIDQATININHGMLTLKLPKINKTRKRILKINF